MRSVVKSLYEAKTQLSKLVDRAATGEEFVIAKNGRPMAKLVPIAKAAPKRKPGGWEGKLWIAKDFDAPLPEELLDLFDGGNTERSTRHPRRAVVARRRQAPRARRP